jgi:alpha-tubulin suppressor-like RCC1 family protein
MNWPCLAPRSARTLALLAWTLCSLIGCGGGGGGDSTVADEPLGPPPLTVPVVTVAPQDTTVQEGEPARFSVTATGGSLFYVWRVAGRDVVEASGAELVLSAVTPAQDGAMVTVTVLNAAGSVQASARLGVTPLPRLPAIASQPQPLRLLVGETAQLSVVATGTQPLSYQWFRDGVAVAGAAADTLEVAAAGTADAGSYHVVVSNPVGQLASAAALVTVAQRPQVSAGSDHTLALKSEGSVWAWGDNSAGQLGDGSVTSSNQPVQVMAAPGTPLAGVVAVAAGRNWSLALKSDGSVLAWGRNQSGELGNGGATDEAYPTPVLTGLNGAPLSGVQAVSAGRNHALALRQDGTVLAWGASRILVGNPTADQAFPAPVVDSAGQPITDIVAISAGSVHSLAVRRDGTLWAWGDNRMAQLGDGTSVQREFAAPVLDADGVPLTGIRAAGAPLQASYAVRADGALLAWGSNFSGMLGDGTFTTSPLPVAVLGMDGHPLARVQSVSAGVFQGLALDSDGCVHSWGDNSSFKLGVGSIILERRVAGPVETTPWVALCGAKAIAGGSGEASYAIDAAGRLLGWGRNEDGRLGDGTTTSRRLPVPVLVPGTMF